MPLLPGHWYSFHRPRKDVKLSQPHLVLLQQLTRLELRTLRSQTRHPNHLANSRLNTPLKRVKWHHVTKKYFLRSHFVETIIIVHYQLWMFVNYNSMSLLFHDVLLNFYRFELSFTLNKIKTRNHHINNGKNVSFCLDFQVIQKHRNIGICFYVSGDFNFCKRWKRHDNCKL